MLAEFDVVTPPLDGTILPRVARASVFIFLSHHPRVTVRPQFPTRVRILTADRALTLSELFSTSAANTFQEAFYVGTSAVVITAALIEWQSLRPSASAGTEADVVEVVLPPAGGPGYIAQALRERLLDIQEALRAEG